MRLTALTCTNVRAYLNTYSELYILNIGQLVTNGDLPFLIAKQQAAVWQLFTRGGKMASLISE